MRVVRDVARELDQCCVGDDCEWTCHVADARSLLRLASWTMFPELIPRIVTLVNHTIRKPASSEIIPASVLLWDCFLHIYEMGTNVCDAKNAE